jgi:hypothetical protein
MDQLTIAYSLQPTPPINYGIALSGGKVVISQASKFNFGTGDFTIEVEEERRAERRREEEKKRRREE